MEQHPFNVLLVGSMAHPPEDVEAVLEEEDWGAWIEEDGLPCRPATKRESKNLQTQMDQISQPCFATAQSQASSALQ